MLTKCNEAQAGHRTETWVAAASAIVPGSQCCTFMPVRGHLNMMLRSMLPICARRCSIEIAGQHLRKCPERTRADTERPQERSRPAFIPPGGALAIAAELREHRMSKIIGLLSAVCCIIGSTAPSLGADPLNGKDIAKRWCATCHLIESGQASASDQAPPFTYLAKTPDFDQNRLAFLLLVPHPNMPNMSLNRAEVADLAEYIRSLK